MSSILFYNLYVYGTWKSVTSEILNKVPQNDIVINISFDWRNSWKLPFVFLFILKYKPIKIFVSRNNSDYGETIGFNKFLNWIDLGKYSILTYSHSKGVTKPNRINENDWREFMVYFVMERFDLTQKAFKEGFHLYGVNLRKYIGTEEQRQNTSLLADFWYRGTFVSVNLNVLRTKIHETPLPQDFYGVEAYWSLLTKIENAYSPFNSKLSHYKEPFPNTIYKELEEYTNQGFEEML